MLLTLHVVRLGKDNNLLLLSNSSTIRFHAERYYCTTVQYDINIELSKYYL